MEPWVSEVEPRLRRVLRALSQKRLCRQKAGQLQLTEHASLNPLKLSTPERGKPSTAITSKMTLPRPPRNAAQPIPNGPFEYDEVYYVETTQGKIVVGNGLEVDPETGAISAP